MIPSPQAMGKHLVRAAIGAGAALEFSLVLQGKSSIAFALAKTKSRHQQRSIEALQTELSEAQQHLAEAQTSQASSEQQAAALKHRCQELEAQITTLKQEMDARLSLQASQADAALKRQQDSTTALTAGLQAELAHQRAAAEAQKQQQDRHIAALEAQCAALVAQLDLSHQQAMQAQASMQFEASAQASAQQSYELLHEAFLEQSAVAEEYVRQSQAEFAALHSQIQQLESEQAGWASCVEALGSKLVSSSASRCSLLGAAMTAAEDDSLAPASIRHVLQGAVDAEGSSIIRLQQSAPATPEAPLLMSQPRTPCHSQDLHDAPRRSFSSFEALTLVIRSDYEDEDDCDSTNSPYSSAPASPFSDGQDWCTPIALLLGRQASNGDSAPPSPRRAVSAADRYDREWVDPAEAALEQPMPSTSGRSISPLGRGQLVYQAPAVSGRSKRRGAAKRVSVGSSCSSVVMNVKQQRCKPGQWRCSFKK